MILKSFKLHFLCSFDIQFHALNFSFCHIDMTTVPTQRNVIFSRIGRRSISLCNKTDKVSLRVVFYYCRKGGTMSNDEILWWYLNIHLKSNFPDFWFIFDGVKEEIEDHFLFSNRTGLHNLFWWQFRCSARVSSWLVIYTMN